MKNEKKVAEKKQAEKVLTSKKSKVTTVISKDDAALKALFKTLKEKNSVKETIDNTDKKSKAQKHVFKTKYFTVIHDASTISVRDCTAKSREHNIQNMLLTNKTIQAIYKYFASTFQDEKSRKSAKRNNMTLNQYIMFRFNKYFSQECNKIKNHFVISIQIKK